MKSLATSWCSTEASLLLLGMLVLLRTPTLHCRSCQAQGCRLTGTGLPLFWTKQCQNAVLSCGQVHVDPQERSDGSLTAAASASMALLQCGPHAR